MSVLTELQAARRLIDAQQTLLREWANGLSCEHPDRYGRDCGRCKRCRSLYREGALEPAWECGDGVSAPCQLKRGHKGRHQHATGGQWPVLMSWKNVGSSS